MKVLLWCCLFVMEACAACGHPLTSKLANPLINTDHLDANKTADTLWSDITEESFARKDGRKDYAKRYRVIKLDTAACKRVLAQAGDNTSLRNTKAIISLPLPDGSFTRFRFVYASAMSPELAAKHTDVRTYTAQGLDDVYANAAFDMTAEGFHAMITREDKVVFIEPYKRNDPVHYICYYKHDIVAVKREPFEEKGPDQP
jgi:hypothetical protein